MIEDAKNKVRVTACAILEKDNKLLLIKRNTEPFKGYWSLPGGHIDFGESAETAVIREVKEETGLEFKPTFLGYRDELHPEIGWHAEVLLFYGPFSGKESIDGKEVSSIEWVNTKEAAKMKLAFEHEKTLEIYLKRRQR